MTTSVDTANTWCSGSQVLLRDQKGMYKTGKRGNKVYMEIQFPQMHRLRKLRYCQIETKQEIVNVCARKTRLLQNKTLKAPRK